MQGVIGLVTARIDAGELNLEHCMRRLRFLGVEGQRAVELAERAVHALPQLLVGKADLTGGGVDVLVLHGLSVGDTSQSQGKR